MTRRLEDFMMRLGRFSRQVQYSMIAALFLVGGAASRALAQSDHQHAPAAQQELTPEQKSRANALVKEVRGVTAGWQTPQTLPQEYQLLFGCVSGGDFGAMGLHFVNLALVGDGEINPDKPEIVLYEPLPNGRMRITGADYVVYAADWDAKHPHDPPQLGGQLFHLFDSPNRFGLPAFYTLHVWAWKDNPAGTFTNWNPNVSCDAFAPPNP
jgi:hypothetical protein